MFGLPCCLTVFHHVFLLYLPSRSAPSQGYLPCHVSEISSTGHHPASFRNYTSSPENEHRTVFWHWGSSNWHLRALLLHRPRQRDEHSCEVCGADRKICLRVCTYQRRLPEGLFPLPFPLRSYLSACQVYNRIAELVHDAGDYDGEYS